MQHRKEHDIYIPPLIDHVEPCTLHLASNFSHMLCHHNLLALLRLHHYRKSVSEGSGVENRYPTPDILSAVRCLSVPSGKFLDSDS